MRQDLWERLQQELAEERRTRKPKPHGFVGATYPPGPWVQRYLQAIASGLDQKHASVKCGIHWNIVRYWRLRSLRFTCDVMDARLRARDPVMFMWLDTVRIARQYRLPYNIGGSLQRRRQYHRTAPRPKPEEWGRVE